MTVIVAFHHLSAGWEDEETAKMAKQLHASTIRTNARARGEDSARSLARVRARVYGSAGFSDAARHSGVWLIGCSVRALVESDGLYLSAPLPHGASGR